MTEPPLNLDHGFTVSVYFPPGSAPAWVSAFLDRVAEDAHSMPSDTRDAFVVGHARDMLGVDADEQELAYPEALELVDELGQQAYRAEDRLAFVKEMCDLADREQRQVTTEQVRAWTNYEGCGGAIVLTEQQAETLADDLLAGRVKRRKARALEPEPVRLCLGLNRIGPGDDVCGWVACRCHKLAAEMKKALQEARAEADSVPPARELTEEEQQQFASAFFEAGVDTPGCDCLHEGMGFSWHARDCAWRSAGGR